MPGRDLMVRIRADVSDFQNKMRLAKGHIADFDKTAASSTTKTGKALNALGLTYRGVGVAAVASVAGLGGAMVKAAADFDQGMSNVKATGADAVKNIDALRQAALKAGADTKFSATEAAGGVEALAKAGVTSADILGGGLSGALDLAAAGNLDVAGSAEAAASAMNQFGLKGRDVPHIADLLAAGAGKAQGEVSDMAMALNQAGLVANTFGFSIEETTGVLAEFAASGLTGSDAGTSLKTMLIRLAAPTDVAAASLKKYGIETRNANGELKNASQIAGELQAAFKDVDAAERDAALSAIFGQDAIRGASILYQDGAEKAAKWTEAVDDAGFAADTAATKMDNLRGDLEQLKGSLDTLFIQGGGGAQGPLRMLVQDLTDLTNAVGAIEDVIPKGKGGILGDAFNLLTPLGQLREFRDMFKQTKREFEAGGLTGKGGIAGKTGVAAETVLKFKTEGAKGAIGDAVKVARAANLTPKQVKSTLKLLGWKTTSVTAVLKEMQKIERKAFVARLKLLNPQLTEKQIAAIVKKMDDAGKPRKPTKLTADGKQALSTLSSIQKELLGIKDKEVTVTTHYETTGKKPGPWMGGRVGEWAGLMGLAGGGRVPGVGPSDGSDNVYARDQHGRGLAVRSREWIINEKQSDLNDRYLRAINAGADFNKILPGFAGGGRVDGDGAAAPVASSSRIISGNISINGLDGHIEAIAVDVIDGDAAHRASRARAGGR